MIDPEEVIRICAQEAWIPPKITEYELERTQPVHVPVKIPPKESRPVRDSDEQPSRSDIVDDLLDEIFNG